MRVQRVLAAAVVLLFLVSLGFGQTQGRVEPYRFTVTDTAIFLGSCSEGFDIYYDDVALLHGQVRFDNDGNPVEEVFHIKILGETIYYNSTDSEKSVLGGPGENQVARIIYLEDGTVAVELLSGLAYKVVLKGYGPAFFHTGHKIIDPQTGEILFDAGPDQALTEDFAALCNALK
jgi:hypothetical protein